MSHRNGKPVSTWRQFAHQVRARQATLLDALGDFDDAILVTGCQRSGGTMLNRVIMGTEGIANFKFSKDEELDAAQILSGRVATKAKGRYCFQTTYLNERYAEYLRHPNNRIVWSLRNPFSVAYSMVYNWRSFALNELFLTCGYGHMDHADRVRFQRFGIFGVPKIRRAAYAYAGKISQLFELSQTLSGDRLIVLEYDDLVQEKVALLPMLYDRLGLVYRDEYGDMISTRSIGKQSKLKPDERLDVDRICSAIYADAVALVNLRQ